MSVTIVGRSTRGTPRASVPIRSNSGSNAAANRKTVKKMSEAQALTGLTAEELRAEQVRLRALALQRFGKAA